MAHVRTRYITSFFFALVLSCSGSGETATTDSAAPATPSVRTVMYAAGGDSLKGFFAVPANVTGKRPGVLVVHEWWGHNEHAQQQARRLAEAGYVGFALDMYGDGKSTTHPDSANAFMMQAVSDQPKMVARFRAALEELKRDPNVDSTKIAAIGYCFGGSVVLAMARAGEPLTLVGSFHGAIPPGAPVDSGTIKARMLIMTGADDPMVPTAQADSFAVAMRKAGAQVTLMVLPHAKHGFTNPRADSVGMPGLGYNAAADTESWAALRKALEEAFR